MISGATTVCFTLAHPVAHVRTPTAFNALAAERGIDVVMVPIDVAPDDLAGFLSAMRRTPNVSGAVVTIPHKTSAVLYCDEISRRAEQCGAVNVIRRTEGGRLFGDMFDGLGFVEGLRRDGHLVEGRSVLLAGAGGAASAIAFALAEANIARLGIFNRTGARARDLAARVRTAFPHLVAEAASDDPAGFDIVVNATPLGLKPMDPLPINASGLTKNMLVAEVVMQPQRTPLIEAAARIGAPTHLGEAMLAAQLDLIFSVLAPPRESGEAQAGYNTP